MRFKRWPRIEPYLETPRRRAALLASQKRVRDRHPLLAPLIGEAQPSPDDVMDARRASWPQQQQAQRDRRAAIWRRARARLWSLDLAERRQVTMLWNTAPYPADPTYLLDFLHRLSTGALDLATLRWRMSAEDAAAAQARLAQVLACRPPNPAPAPRPPYGRAVTLRRQGLLTAGDHD